MEPNNTNELFVNLLDDYNQAFYDKDISRLKEFYDSTIIFSSTLTITRTMIPTV